MRGGWTEERIALAVRLRQEGLSAGKIAEQLGNVTRNAVIGQLYREGSAPPPQWPEDRTERLKALRLDGLSCTEIATTLGVTRNAVITKLARLGIPAPEKRQASAPAPRRPRVAAVQAPAVASSAARLLPAPAPVERAPDGGVRLVDRRRAQCAFPLGENAEGDSMCCGGPLGASDGSYCRDHRLIMFRPNPTMNPRYLDKSTRRRSARDQDEDLPAGLDGKVA